MLTTYYFLLYYALNRSALAWQGFKLFGVEVIVEFEHALLIAHRHRCASAAGERAVGVEFEALRAHSSTHEFV